MGNVFNKEKPTYVFALHSYRKVLHSLKSERVPIGRSGHRIVCDSSNLYSFGGYNPTSNNQDDELSQAAFPLFQELWRFNFATLKWTRYKARETIPCELASNAVVIIGNHLLVRFAIQSYQRLLSDPFKSQQIKWFPYSRFTEGQETLSDRNVAIGCIFAIWRIVQEKWIW